MANFRPTKQRRERILIYGDAGQGKSYAWLSILLEARDKGYDGTFYIIDSDNTWEPFRDEYDLYDLEDEGLVEVFEPADMDEALKISAELTKKARRGDWIIIDMIGWFWEEAQDHYTRGVYGYDPADYFIVMRQEVQEAKEKGKGSSREFGGHDGKDWVWIKKVYRQFLDPLRRRSKAHMLVVTGEKQLSEHLGADRETLATYKHVKKMAPSGEKRLRHDFDTVLRATKRSDDLYRITMVKDRGRQEKFWTENGSKTLDMKEHPRAFAKAYLRGVAGWTSRKVKD